MENSKFKHHLQKYSGMSSKHICPNCGRKSLTLYVDDTGEAIAQNVGRCDHQNSCGYHLAPADYFKTNPEKQKASATSKPQPQPKRPTDYVNFTLIEKSQSIDNQLMRYLSKFFFEESLAIVTYDYYLGSAQDGSILFPQIDIEGRCRSGKFVLYNDNGHRIKAADGDKIDWLHSRILRKQKSLLEAEIGRKMSYEETKDFYRTHSFNLSQCLFGEHLLSKYPNKVVCLVEAEKTAVVMAMAMPDFLWLATGGSNNFKPEMLKVLQGRDVIIYEDADMALEGHGKETFAKSWRGKVEEMRASGFANYFRSMRFSDWADSETMESHRDIADLILAEMEFGTFEEALT